jgi:hypothetical protein
MSGHEARASLLGGGGPIDYSYQPFSGGYHERAGYPVKDMSKRRSLKETARPGWSTWSWAFMGTALVQAAIILAFESYIFATFQLDLKSDAKTQTQARTIPTFLTLYIFGFVYQLVLVWDALRLKNTIQIIGLVAYNVGLLIYGSVQMSQIKSAVLSLHSLGDIDLDIWYHTKPFLIAIPCIIAFGTCLLSVVAWKLYDEFAWTIYKHISADLRLKRRYLTFQVYIALLKFDFFFFLGFTVQFVVIVYNTNLEFSLTIAAIPVTILILFAAAWFTRKEWLYAEIGVIVSIFLSSFRHIINEVSDPLFWRPSLLRLQDVQNVFGKPRSLLQACPERTHHLCRTDHRLAVDDDRQRVHVCAQFRKGSKALRDEAKTCLPRC